MKKRTKVIIAVFLMAIMTTVGTYAMQLSARWIEDSYNASARLHSDVKPTSDGGYIAVGSTRPDDMISSGTPLGGNDGYIIKVDQNGEKEWSKRYGSAAHDRLVDIVEARNGDFIAIGTTGGNVTNGTNNGRDDAWILRIDSTGNELWSKQYGGDSWDNFRSIIPATDGNGYMIVGDTHFVGSPGSYDAWIFKADENGDEIWSKTHNFSTRNDNFLSVQATSDNDYIAVGYTADSESLLFKFDVNGDEIWSKQHSDFFQFTDIKETSNGDFIIAAAYETVLKVNSNGDEVWRKSITIYDEEWEEDTGLNFQSIQITKDGNYIVVGYTGNDSKFVKLDKNGEVLVEKEFRATSNENNKRYTLQSVYEVADGYILGGNVDFFNGPVLIKLEAAFGLSFDANGGEGQKDSIQLSLNEKVTLPNNTFTKAGHTFTGWATSQSNANNGMVAFKNQEEYTHVSSANVTLYAVWQKVDTDDGNDKDEIETKEVEDDSDISISNIPRTGNDLMFMAILLAGLSLSVATLHLYRKKLSNQ